MNAAGEAEFDRLWRLPLDEEYGPQIYSSNADLCNVYAFLLLNLYFLMIFAERGTTGRKLHRCPVFEGTIAIFPFDIR